MAAPEDILVDNLKEALREAHKYIVLGTGVALFLLILSIQDLRGTGTVSPVEIPIVKISAERSLTELISVAIYFISGYMAYLAVSRIERIKVRLHSWPEIRKAALTYPSIPTINITWARMGAAILPALLFSAALLVIFIPRLKDVKDSLLPIIFFVLALSSPYILLIQLLRYPLGETSYKITKTSLDNLKEEGVPPDVLDQLSMIVDAEYTNKPLFLKALKNKIGRKQTDKFRRNILRHASSEEHIED